MSPLTPPDAHLTALLAAAYRLGLMAGRSGGAGAPGGLGSLGAAAGVSGGAPSAIPFPQTGGQIPMTPPGGAHGAPNMGQDGSSGVLSHVASQTTASPGTAPGGSVTELASLAQHAMQQNIAATLRDDSMRDALAKSEQRRQALEIARWAHLASMRGTPTRAWAPDPTMSVPYPF